MVELDEENAFEPHWKPTDFESVFSRLRCATQSYSRRCKEVRNLIGFVQASLGNSKLVSASLVTALAQACHSRLCWSALGETQLILSTQESTCSNEACAIWTTTSHGKSRLRHIKLLTVLIQSVGGRGIPQATLSNFGLQMGTLSPELSYFGLLLATVELIAADTKELDSYQREHGHRS